MPKVRPISPDDNVFPDYLNFDTLRIKGREHIAKLSGKIWTDHNVHDPGITIMEVLAYAILDIGYRNQLEDKELFALDHAAGQEENNFFTAAHILSCNPLTITDLRKLVLDVRGVRNAWFEVSDEAEVDLGIDCRDSRLRYRDLHDDEEKSDLIPLRLNGLYKVYLELEPTEILKKAKLITEESNLVVDQVKCILWEHRNLCEDFVEVIVLGEEELAICAEIELSSDTDTDEAMLKILEAIDGFLSPSITFYTLEQMLAKDKTMDEIFEGRPLTIDSNGFIDTEELESFDRIREIHVSDLYREILKIPGIRGIKKLGLQSFIDGEPTASGLEKWCLKISNDHKPVISTEKLDFTFYKDILPFSPNKKAVVDRFKKRLINVKKANLESEPYLLDFEPPLGRFREDLATYRSIQHDFPLVYGIGEGHLSPTATVTRRAQALQLKGYLLFFDQLLANYLSQLANIRQLFSVTPESLRQPENQHTYFAQRLSNVPKGEALIRFYNEQDTNTGTPEIIAYWLGDLDDLALSSKRILQLLALTPEKEEVFLELFPRRIDQFLQLPSKKIAEFQPLPYAHETRDIFLHESIRDFRNGQFGLEVIQQYKSGEYFYIVKDHLGKPFLRSKQLYQTAQEAGEAMESVVVFGIMEEAYRSFGRMSGTRKAHSFDIVHDPIDYWTYLNNILESREEYLARRDAFLNHLLARFSEHFTDYVLLMFALNGKRHDLKKIVEDKSQFLSNYPETSRNRGRGYNYSDDTGIWNTGNISGFERRVTSLLGIPDYRRQTLSNFQVVEEADIFYYRLYHKGIAVFVSQKAYPSRAAAEQALKEIFNLSKFADKYERIYCQFSGTHTFKLVGANNNVAIHPGTYPSEKVNEGMIEKLTQELTLNMYEPLTTIDPTVQAGKPPESLTNPPGTSTNPPTGFTPVSGSGSSGTSTNPPGSGPGTGSGGSDTSTNPPGSGTPSADPPEASPPPSPVTAPYDYTGNIFVKMDIGKCKELEAPPAFRYRVMDEEDVCARHPETYTVDQYDAARTYLLNQLDNIRDQYSTLTLGESKVVIFIEGHYYYQLIPQEEEAVLWRSCASFQSADEAHEAFQNDFFELIELAREEENYRKVEIDEIETIVLVRSEGDYPAMVPPEELENVRLKKAIRIRREHAMKYPVVRKPEESTSSVEKEETETFCARFNDSPPVIEEEGDFGFRLIELDKKLNIVGQEHWVNTKYYENPVDAWFGFSNCLSLLLNPDNWVKTEDEQTGELGFAIGEVLLKSEFSYLSEQDAWVGTKGFANQFREENAVATYIDFWQDCCCAFRVVSDDYRLAVHPYHYNAPEEREVALNCLRNSAQQRESFFQLVHSEITRTEDTNPNSPVCYVYFIRGESGEWLWQGYRSFENDRQALDAYEKNHITIMNLAREAENYHIIKVSDQYRVALRNEQNKILAVIPQWFSADEADQRLEEIVKRIKLARQFPIVATGSGFKFDIYDLNFDREQLLDVAWKVIDGKTAEAYCPEVPDTDQLAVSAPKGGVVEEKTFLLQCIDELVPGGVILESVQVYSGRTEIDFIISWLRDHQYLFRQHDSYQPVQDLFSGPFSFEWVNPVGILATVPRRFLLQSECEAALARAGEKVHAEGVHVVEHLLLRPLKMPDKYVLKVKDKTDRVILYGLGQYPDPETAEGAKSSLIACIQAAAAEIQERLDKNLVSSQVWQQRLSLWDRNDTSQLIAVGCRLPRGETDFRAQIAFLCDLGAEQVEPCLFKDKACDETLLEVCIDPKDCISQAAGKVTERCGVKFEAEADLFDNYIHGADPYSFWLSVIIPYWPERFQNTNFRAFFENTIRRELPAYVVPRIIWVNPLQMRAFEKAYRAWLKAKSKVVQEKAKLESTGISSPEEDCLDLKLEPPVDDSLLLAAMDELDRSQKILIHLLFRLTNEYPPARLEAVKFSGGSNVVQLNQTKLV